MVCFTMTKVVIFVNYLFSNPAKLGHQCTNSTWAFLELSAFQRWIAIFKSYGIVIKFYVSPIPLTKIWVRSIGKKVGDLACNHL